MKIEYYEPNEKEIECLSKLTLKEHGSFIFYKSLGNKQYKIYCPECDTTSVVSYEELKQIQHNRSCPYCGESIYQTKRAYSQHVRAWAIIHDMYGFQIDCNWNIDDGFSDISYYQVAYFPQGTDSYSTFYTRNIAMNSSHRLYPTQRDKWAYRYNRNYVGNFFIFDYQRIVLKNIPGYYKKYLENYKDIVTKSNQKKLCMDNFYKPHQIRGIAVFDLKTNDDVIKYSRYLKCESWELQNYIDRLIKLNLNVFYLDYLSRNNIGITEYMDYAENLKYLGLKLDKPKKEDFDYRNEKIAELVVQKENELCDEKILNRFNSLPTFSKGKVSIKAFNSSDEIIKCGKQLHNCIAGYVKKYAQGTTDLYHLDIDGAIKVAIEIRDGKVEQAYEDRNKQCNKKYIKFIKMFCKENNFAIDFFD